MCIRDSRWVQRYEPLPAGLPASQRLRRGGVCLITGGLGGVGLALAEWLVEQGAGCLVLASRGGGDASVQARAAHLAGRGTEIRIRAADVRDGAAVAALVAACDTPAFALRGVVHAAGVVQDAVLANERWARMRESMAVKVDGAWHLHLATRALALDWFVLCSSAAALLGPAGQGAYAAANAFLDGLAHHRRALKLPATSLDWGAWSGTGGASSSQTIGRLDHYGIEPLTAREATALFAAALADAAPQLTLMRAAWDRWRAARGHVPLLSDMTAGRANEIGSPQAGAALALERYLRDAVASGLGVDPSAIDPARSLAEMGFDSLMAVELRSRLERDRGLRVPIALVFKAVTLAQLTRDVQSRAARIGEAVHA